MSESFETMSIKESDIGTIVVSDRKPQSPLPSIALKPEGDTLVADIGDFRITLAEQDDVWWFMLERKGIRLARGRSLEHNKQEGVLRTAKKMLVQYLALEPHVGTCTACGGDTYPFNMAYGVNGAPISDERWYQARAAAAMEFYGREEPDHLVLRCLDPDCELRKKPQRRA